MFVRNPALCRSLGILGLTAQEYGQRPNMLDLLAGNPLLLLFTVIGLGYLIGSINIFGFKLGVAAVLFVGIFFRRHRQPPESA